MVEVEVVVIFFIILFFARISPFSRFFDTFFDGRPQLSVGLMTWDDRLRKVCAPRSSASRAIVFHSSRHF